MIKKPHDCSTRPRDKASRRSLACAVPVAQNQLNNSHEVGHARAGHTDSNAHGPAHSQLSVSQHLRRPGGAAATNERTVGLLRDRDGLRALVRGASAPTMELTRRCLEVGRCLRGGSVWILPFHTMSCVHALIDHRFEMSSWPFTINQAQPGHHTSMVRRVG